MLFLFVHHRTHDTLLYVLGEPLKVHIVRVGCLHGRLGVGRRRIVALGGGLIVVLPGARVCVGIGISAIILVIIIVVIAADGRLHLSSQALGVLLQESILVVVIPVGGHELLRGVVGHVVVVVVGVCVRLVVVITDTLGRCFRGGFPQKDLCCAALGR